METETQDVSIDAGYRELHKREYNSERRRKPDTRMNYNSTDIRL